MPITAKMKMIMANTMHRFPSAPIVRPMMPISRFSVGHDLASLKTRSYNSRLSTVIKHVSSQAYVSFSLSLSTRAEYSV